MPKSYPEELAEWVKKREATRPRQDKNVVAFLALKSDVQDAIAAGYSLLTIWEHLHEKGKIPYRYETFLKHVRRHFKGQPPAVVDGQPSTPPDPPRPPAAGKTAAPRPQQPTKSTPPAPAGFKFDSQPKKEDLL